jgi:FAD/FMN-containing dehydrogenase
MSLGDDLRKVMRGEIESAPEVLEKYSRDASLFKVTPEVVVCPLDADDVASVVRFVARKKAVPKTHISITPRSGGTDMSGGPLGDSIVLDMTKHMNHLLNWARRLCVVEPGMYFRDFDKETKKRISSSPATPPAARLCTVGGMAANNSGGEKNLKYGKTARYVQELEVVLSDGQKHTLREFKGDALAHKLTEESFEGEIYRKMSALVSTLTHQKVIKEHAPKVEKNSSGYALWDIGDGKSAQLWRGLFVGSQGTLGIITKIKFGLVHPQPYAAMTSCFLIRCELGEVVPQVLRTSPTALSRTTTTRLN